MAIKILRKYGKEELAYLYIAENPENGNIVEFVESVQPPIPREKKWVLIISTLYGCPIGCKMCDAGTYYRGKLNYNTIISQIDYLIKHRYPDGNVQSEKFKIQFARIGEPALNPNVLKVLKEMPERYEAPGIIPCISTVAPNSANPFFEKLLAIKDKYYPNGHFQIQFSVHSTDQLMRSSIISENIWTLEEIAEYGEKWYKKGDRKITLNFAVSEESIIEPAEIRNIFNPRKYFIKLTPVNPTYQAVKNQIKSGVPEEQEDNYELAEQFKALGYETLLSIGEREENQIGTNCGQFATDFQDSQVSIKKPLLSKSYTLEKYSSSIQNSKEF